VQLCDALAAMVWSAAADVWPVFVYYADFWYSIEVIIYSNYNKFSRI